MTEQTMRDNQTLLAFWDQVFTVPEEEKEAARREGAGPWEEQAPSEKLLRAACELGSGKRRHQVLSEIRHFPAVGRFDLSGGGLFAADHSEPLSNDRERHEPGLCDCGWRADAL